MTTGANRPIMAGMTADSFIGREAEMARLTALARSRGASPLVVLSAPGSGASELMRQVYDRMFADGSGPIPFYFEVRRSDGDARRAALRFAREFLTQAVAFRLGDRSIITASPGLAELAELAPPSDGHWIDRIIESIERDAAREDDSAFIRACLGSPLRAMAHGACSVVLVDAVHDASGLIGGEMFLDALIVKASTSIVPFVLCGRRRSMFARTDFESLRLEPLSFSDAGRLTERLAHKTNTRLTAETRDLIAVQMAGNAKLIAEFLSSATGEDLETFEQVEQAYTDEILGGRISREIGRTLDRTVPGRGTQEKVLSLMAETLDAPGGSVPERYWRRNLSIESLDQILTGLHESEMINLSSGSVSMDRSNTVLSDYVRARISLEIDRKPRALAVGEAVAANTTRAPRLMASHYRRTAAFGLREIMLSFSGQMISPALMDYGRFKTQYKGADDEKILKAIKDDTERRPLPHVVYTAHTSAFYPPLDAICEPEHSAIAIGFATENEGTAIAWLAAQIDSKLEATGETAEFWCDRLQMAAESCDFAEYRLWLIAPEGFDDEALTILNERSAYGSSRKQLELLAGVLNTPIRANAAMAADEYEIVVPMGEDTEIVAARTIEDIAQRYDIPQKTINQIKTAVVEACINASEHSLSPDQKIYQKFSVDGDTITISIYNRGLRLTDKKPKAKDDDEGRRGWGLKLMQGLMDDVRIEQTDDGTRITMVKSFVPAAA